MNEEAEGKGVGRPGESRTEEEVVRAVQPLFPDHPQNCKVAPPAPKSVAGSDVERWGGRREEEAHGLRTVVDIGDKSEFGAGGGGSSSSRVLVWLTAAAADKVSGTSDVHLHAFGEVLRQYTARMDSKTRSAMTSAFEGAGVLTGHTPLWGLMSRLVPRPSPKTRHRAARRRQAAQPRTPCWPRAGSRGPR